MERYYSEEYRCEFLELSDNRIDWDFGTAVGSGSIKGERAEELYAMAQRLYTFDFEQHYHVNVFLCGRSGRHVCVADNAENRRRYEVMRRAVALMQKLIVAVASGNSACVGNNEGFCASLPQWIARVHKANKREIEEFVC